MNYLVRAVVVLVAAILSAGSVAHAQSASDAALLRSEIRAALMSDPRSAALAEGELVALVEALADETENEGVVYDFMPPRPVQSFQSFAAEFATPWGQPITKPALYGIILLSLIIAFLLLKKMFEYHRRMHSVA